MPWLLLGGGVGSWIGLVGLVWVQEEKETIVSIFI